MRNDMKKVTFCGHTGSHNHGCEAIIKSTADLFNDRGVNVVLTSHDLDGDKKFGIEEFNETIEYVNFVNNKFKRLISVGFSRVLNMKNVSNAIVQKPVWDKLKDTLVLNVGGDTYCYAKPYPSIYLNKYCEKKGLKNVLWACSIEEDVVNDPDIRKDLDKYSRIYPRETLTYNALVKAGYPEEKLFLTCDPAFTMRPKVTELPEGFKKNNTVAINISPTILAYSNNQSAVVSGYCKIIDEVLNTTDCSVALVPHVYNGKREDIKALSELYKNYENNERVVFFNKAYSCRELKYIISQCCFLIAARTHASIAAYSSCVPALVVGYSVKAKGIAIDLFGKYEGYVLPVQDIDNEEKLLETFKNIFAQREEMKNKLTEVMPEYSSRAGLAIDNCIADGKLWE